MIRTLLRPCLAALTVLLAACTAPSGGTPGPGDGTANGDGPSERVFGTVEYYSNPFRAAVPATATTGEPFGVTVATYGGGCTEKGETAVQLEGLRAEIRLYDVDTEPATGGCADIFRTHEHTATVTFAEAGEAEITFYGLKEDASGVVNVSHTRTLEVLSPPPPQGTP